jgi:hypothetical protein
MKPVMSVAMVVVLAGCYNYMPVTLTPAPQSGTYMLATLNDSGASALAGYLGVEARAVRGRSEGFDDAGLHLSVAAVETQRGDEIGWRGEMVTLPSSVIAATSVRRLAKGRTAMLVGISIAAVVGTFVGFSLRGGADSPGQGGPPPNPR